ncbi:SDR family oxidoreductase [Nocardia vermiculata]|uniref:SDR family oxidoreductase n=1 Tax=Nocardia vermiculata TaxID=257274 RepID=UPI000B33E8DD|nr:SDR family oxidoreductase [Nocardia vermiculata]
MDSQRIVLVTGASRGIGADTARILAGRGDHVLVNYREKAKRATELVDSIAAAGGTATPLGADLADPEQSSRLIEEIADRFERLDVLVLNASGGLEHGAAPDYAMRINRDAQVRLVEQALPVLAPGGRIVFVTSHQAHFHGRKPTPPGYEPIAASKRAGEDALRAMAAEFAARGIGFTVVSGDMIEGTIIVRLLERRDPDAVAARTEHGALPTVEEFATAIADATAATDAGPGHTVYVGGADYLTGA